MKKILITGASGFVAYHIIKKFYKEYYFYLLDKQNLKKKLPNGTKYKFYKKRFSKNEYKLLIKI